MQPRNPYQSYTQVSNMDFPTEAYMAAAANAARIQADAQAKLGEQIGRGLQSAASSISGAMTEKAAQKADYEASSKLYDSPSFRQAMGLSEDGAKQQKTILKDLVGEGGYKAANAYAKQQIDSLLTYAAASRAFEMNKELQLLKNAPEYARITASLASRESTPDLAGLGKGLRQVTGVAAPAPEQPTAPAMQFDVTGPAQKLQDFMSSKYGPDYKSRGIRASTQDVMDAGL